KKPKPGTRISCRLVNTLMYFRSHRGETSHELTSSSPIPLSEVTFEIAIKGCYVMVNTGQGFMNVDRLLIESGLGLRINGRENGSSWTLLIELELGFGP